MGILETTASGKGLSKEGEVALERRPRIARNQMRPDPSIALHHLTLRSRKRHAFHSSHLSSTSAMRPSQTICSPTPKGPGTPL
jgi:hypothetical protein